MREAALLNERGVKLPKPKRTAVKPPVVPEELLALLKKNAKARATFEALSPSCQRESIEWITEAKQLETRQRRIATTLEWLAEGKSRNWTSRADKAKTHKLAACTTRPRATGRG